MPSPTSSPPSSPIRSIPCRQSRSGRLSHEKPITRPKDIRPKQPRERNAWFRPGECLRLIYDELREATQPLTTRELAERIMRLKAISPADSDRRERVQKTLLASLNRAKHTIARVESAGVVRWR